MAGDLHYWKHLNKGLLLSPAEKQSNELISSYKQ